MTALNDKQARLITEGKNFAHIATLKKDGSPQVTPIWVDYDGTYVIFNSEEKRAKVKNLKRDPRVSFTVTNAENQYEYIQIAGRVVEITTDGAAAGIDKLAKKYIGQDKYPNNKPSDVRVVIKVEPEHVTGS